MFSDIFTMSQTESSGTNWLRENIHRDMQAFGCLVAEIFLSPKLRILDVQSSLQQRYELIRNVCQKSMDDLPRYGLQCCYHDHSHKFTNVYKL